MIQENTEEHLVDDYQQRLIRIFKEYLKNEKVEIYLFGSRAQKTAHEASDIDLAIRYNDLPAGTLSRFREALHESYIPYKIDVVDFSKAGKALKKSIYKEGILIWKN